MPIQTVVPSKRLVLNGQTLTPTTTTKKQCISLIILRKNRNRRKEQKMYQNNHWRLLKRQQLTIVFLWKLSKLRRRNVTSFQMQFEKWGRGFPPPMLSANSPVSLTWESFPQKHTSSLSKMHAKKHDVGASLQLAQFPQKSKCCLLRP